MKIRFLSAALCMSTLLQPTFADAAEESLVLAPSSRWNLDYGEESCRLGRTFGEGENKVLLIFAKYAPGISMEVMASGVPLSAKRARSFTYSFDPAEKIEEERPFFGDLESGGTIWQFSGKLIPPATFDNLQEAEASKAEFRVAESQAADATKSITFKVGGKAPVILETGGLGGVLSAMDACLDDLVSSWGYDLEIQKSIVKEPEAQGDMSKWLDYPTLPLRRGLSGSVRYRLAIDEEGRLTDCIIQSNHSDPIFGEEVCNRFMRRARYEPARNAQGEGVRSYVASTVVFISG